MQGNKLVDFTLESKILKNPRRIFAYIPTPKHHESAKKHPVLYGLAAWTNAGRNMFEWKAFRESLPERLDRLIATGKIPPTVVVCPDLYTEFGGSQYIDSEYFGAHASFLVQEVFPFVEANLPVLPGWQHRGVFGRSSGGFGAIRLAMDFPDAVAAIACHSGDMGFDYLFGTDILAISDRLRRFNNSIPDYLKFCKSQNKLSGGDINALMLLGCAGFYSPNLANENGFDLPLDLYSGAKIPAVWEKWLAHDPVRRAALPQSSAHLKKLKLLYFDCGIRDQYHLLYGARQLGQQLDKLSIKHRYFEFDDDHSGTDYRYDVSFPEMLAALQ